ncbi:MAG: HEPN domain-containing protein [Desulfobacterales bacterium]|nr:HEPN domain-containing protein [Desulfobacterales bacterium]
MKNEDVLTLIKYRLEQAKGALNDAKCLLDSNRTSQGIINRAYYAMFYATLALVIKTGKTFSKHSGVISVFDIDFVREGLLPKELSKDLHKVFRLRNESDYIMTEEPSFEQAKETYDKAVNFVALVIQYFQLNNQTGLKED